jgi:DNA modification methylase
MLGAKQIKMVSVELLIPYAKNARTHSDEQVAQIAGSIKEFGFNNPVLVDADNSVIAGHGRLMAARKLGLKEVPVVKLEHLTESQRKAYVLADNRIALNSGWDTSMLTLELQDLKDEIDLSLLGFDADELDAMLNPIEETEGLTDEDAVPEVPVEPKTKLGDVYILGNHRLMCGDSTSIDAIEKLMNGDVAELVFTDPPYRMEVEGGSNQLVGRAAAKLGEMIKHLCEFDPVAFLNTLPTVFKKNTLNAYIFCNKDLVPDYLHWAVESGYAFNILFWKKPNAIPLGGQHRPDVEYLLVFRKSAVWNNGLKDVNYSKCLEHGRDIGKDHPTKKPVELIENQVKISSTPNSVVLDFFGGSGSTMIACEKQSRKSRLMELDPKYCDVIVKRWEDFTGKKATLLSELEKEEYAG